MTKYTLTKYSLFSALADKMQAEGGLEEHLQAVYDDLNSEMSLFIIDVQIDREMFWEIADYLTYSKSGV